MSKSVKVELIAEEEYMQRLVLRGHAIRAGLEVAKGIESNVVQDAIVRKSIEAGIDFLMANMYVAPPEPKPTIWQRLVIWATR